ncbi:uncharacterized protein BDR25DRAFT_308765 [Lindgomyces ingoldianus]|uniref:Uncharacterized protein n=1 Tax=Lindgomyces ingoldianus TaxID=673940 RepID=A0ACB6RF10_9PLEO|nr:uncharacterized protein BDR25DRAFT_308765 [Lindgomyces ingoldianus]KAF2477919.1 hypothetical protein BDR25DRAFT_308765 [Lindgomyces ingoldianus]
MLWMIIDHALRLVDTRCFPCPRRWNWFKIPDEIDQDVMGKGYNPKYIREGVVDQRRASVSGNLSNVQCWARGRQRRFQHIYSAAGGINSSRLSPTSRIASSDVESRQMHTTRSIRARPSTESSSHVFG